MLIAQITDVHIGFDRGNPEEANMARLNAVIQRLVESPNTPDLLVMTGDLTEFGDLDSYLKLADAVGSCPFPVYAMAGNHDARDALLAALPATSVTDGFIQYAVEGEGLSLLMLDTLEEGRHGGGFCEERAAWLQAQLAARADTPTVIAMHHPPFESGIEWLDGNAKDDWVARFAETVSGHDQVKAVICGHLHRNIHTVWNGLSLTVCASTAPLVALDLRPVDSAAPDNRAMITDEYPGYALHRWDGERLVSHFEAVYDHRVIARFDESLKDVVQLMDDERRGRR